MGDIDESTAGENSTPPWGDDFDAERAWNTIQTQRTREKELLARDVLTDEQKERLTLLDSILEADVTDAERWQGRAEEAESKVTPLQSENTRLKVALKKGLPAELVDRLKGTTEEEVLADADALLALGLATAAAGGMRPNPAQGTSGAGSTSLDDQIAAARKAGNVREAVRLESRKLLNPQ